MVDFIQHNKEAYGELRDAPNYFEPLQKKSTDAINSKLDKPDFLSKDDWKSFFDIFDDASE